jgi:hypothetical protein
VDFVSSSGALLNSREAAGARLIGGERGFIGHMAASTESWLEAWNDSGSQLPGFHLSDPRVRPAAEDPLGGVVVGHEAYPAGLLEIIALDSNLAERWRMKPPEGPSLALAVDRAGATLFLFGGSRTRPVSGMWIDHGGNAGPVFEMREAYPTAEFTLTQRTGSGLFLAIGGVWVAQIDSMATRPNTSLHMVRGGNGYAVLPAGGADTSECAQDIEVFSPSGMRCGATRFRAANGSCRTGAISVGYDGTVMQAAIDPDPSHFAWFGPSTCYWHWWRGFYR